jgi:hypothetical protein
MNGTLCLFRKLFDCEELVVEYTISLLAVEIYLPIFLPLKFMPNICTVKDGKVMNRFWKIFLFILISAAYSSAQSLTANGDSTSVLIGSQGHFGTILPHSKTIAHLADTRIWGGQVDISRIRYTHASWNTCNCYSQNGISFSYFNFTNPEELGSSLTIAVFAEPQLTYGKLQLTLRGSAGISYLTRVYHPDTNPRNLFFSVPWSGLLMAQVSARYNLHPLWFLRVSTVYHHISNGGKRQPNKGMNFPAVSLGLDYAIRHNPVAPKAKNRTWSKSFHYYAGFSYNTRAVDESNLQSQDRKMVIGLQGDIYKQVARMHALGLGLEVTHDGSLKEQARQLAQPYDHHIISALLRHHFLFGRFDFSQALGIYLHKEYPNRNTVFQRYVIQYRILEKLQLGFSLKAHLHSAEQMDVRLGFVL